MPQTVTIEIADDGATAVTVEMDGAEPQMMDFASTGEALEALQQILSDEGSNPEAMWEEEASARATPTPDEEMM